MAETAQPSLRRLYIYRDAPSADEAATRGWSFVVEALVEGAPAEPIFDTWEATFAEILRYPGLYADDDLAWCRPGNAEPIILEDLLAFYR